jgi:hypothetical protein
MNKHLHGRPPQGSLGSVRNPRVGTHEGETLFGYVTMPDRLFTRTQDSMEITGYWRSGRRDPVMDSRR